MTAQSLFDDSDRRVEELSGRGAVRQSNTLPAGAGVSSSLYRKYRPHSFGAEELVGQDHIVRTLRNAIALDRIAHAYLFSGPRGTGKTTTARLLAKAVNCLDPDPEKRPCNECLNCAAINANASPDIIEIDAASNRGIDDIRDLRERIRYAPAQLPSKVYIIDEAHQITGAAANAFLKTLEEPPSHSRFILATTDPEELLPTIVSRCQRFEFRRVGADDMLRRLKTVAILERIAISDDALRLIARHATGSLRDALGLLEQLALLAHEPGAPEETTAVDEEAVRAALGLSRNDRVESIALAIAERNPGSALEIVQQALDAGEDPRQLNRQLVTYLRHLMLERAGGAPATDDQTTAIAQQFSLSDLARHARRFGEIDFTMKHAPFPQLPLEIALVEATAQTGPSAPSEASSQATRETPRPEPAARPMSLRDRVRAPSAIRELPPPEPAAPVRTEPVPIVPLRPEPVPAAAPVPSPSSDSAPEVEHIAELWPKVRADVKALNRRIEALLSEVDPVSVSGNQITLAVPYPFHRDKLNSDDVRDTVSSVLSRLLQRDITIACILRSEMTVAPAPAPRGIEPTRGVIPVEVDVPEVSSKSDEEERAQVRLRAALNIFDAEQVSGPEPETESPQFAGQD
jgi:DNA polymerase-3 subunit gamma/tau